jgi:RimJ/RimL family protein N-acetyltransferase
MANGVDLLGERVSLCPFGDVFWAVGLGWYNDPEIIAMTSDDPNPLTMTQFRDMIQVDLDNAQSVVLGVVNEIQKPIGVGMLRHVDGLHRSCELHITIGEKDHWGRGYGTEAIGLMRDYAFVGLELHRVISTPFVYNTRMVRSLEKCGFEREGLLRDALWIQGRFTDVVIMAMLNPADPKG